jgi:hypothetical protein
VLDRPPLWIYKRLGKGVGKPEYRLHALWVPALFNLTGSGLFGADLLYYLSWEVLALGTVLYMDNPGGKQNILVLRFKAPADPYTGINIHTLYRLSRRQAFSSIQLFINNFSHPSLPTPNIELYI